MLSIKVGADPEGFLMVGNDWVSADGLFPGDKKTPFKVDRGAIQVDGMAVEFNIDAASDEDEFERNMSTVITQLNEYAKKVDRNAKIVWTPFVEFNEDVWNASSQNSKILGCDPDWNYDGEVNQNPSDRLEGARFRTAAGHVHIGWTANREIDTAHFADCHMIAKHFHDNRPQFFVPTTHEEERRLQYYGMNASFRPKSYGVELRSPSNMWVGSEKNRRQMYRVVREQMKMIVGA